MRFSADLVFAISSLRTFLQVFEIEVAAGAARGEDAGF
jgi:hypothetical protein